MSDPDQDITIYTGEVANDTALTVYGEIENGTITKWLEAKASRSAKTRQAYETVIGQFRAQLQHQRLDLFADARLVASVASDYVKTLSLIHI